MISSQNKRFIFPGILLRFVFKIPLVDPLSIDFQSLIMFQFIKPGNKDVNVNTNQQVRLAIVIETILTKTDSRIPSR